MTETELLPKGVAVCRRRVGRWKPIVTEYFSAQGPRGIRLFGEPPLAELGHDVLDELGVAAGNRGVEQEGGRCGLGGFLNRNDDEVESGNFNPKFPPTFRPDYADISDLTPPHPADIWPSVHG